MQASWGARELRWSTQGRWSTLLFRLGSEAEAKKKSDCFLFFFAGLEPLDVQISTLKVSVILF